MLRRAIVPKPTLHPARHANRDGAKLPREMFLVEPGVPVGEPLGHGFVVGARSLPTHRPAWRRRLDHVRHDPSLRGTAFCPRASFDECDDRLVHLDRRGKIAFVDSKLKPAKADHDIAIARQLASGDPLEPKASQLRQELVGIAGRRRRLEVERELSRVGPPAEQRP